MRQDHGNTRGTAPVLSARLRELGKLRDRENLAPSQGVRREGAILQMGLKKSEIAKIARALESLLKQVDSGDVKTF